MFVIFLLMVLTVLLLVFGFVSLINAKSERGGKSQYSNVWSRISAGITFLFLIILLVLTSTYTVDEGEAVILKRFGKVIGQEYNAGFHFKSPWVSTISWQIRLAAFDEQISARTKDGMQVTVDTTTWWSPEVENLDKTYSKVAKNYDTLFKGYVVPGQRSAVRDEIAKATWDELNQNRDKYANSVTEYTKSMLSKKYINIDRVNIRNIIPPETVNAAIEAKIKTEQQKQEADYKLELARKNALIREEEARGMANAQDIIQKKLTPLYVQYEAIQAYRELASSPNTTFVIMPTSPSGAYLSNSTSVPFVRPIESSFWR